MAIDSELSSVVFDPDTWTVWENFREKEYIEAFNLLLEPEGEFAGARRRVSIPPRRLEQVIGLGRTREHEWTHFRQHLSTEWGLFCHRLCGLREMATVNFFDQINNSGRPFEPMPLGVRLAGYADREMRFDDPRANDWEHFWLVVWRLADLVEGALWSKTMEMKHLLEAWNGAIKVLAPSRYMQGDSPGALLRTTRAEDTQCVPDNHITVHDLVESFARYREFWFAAALSSVEIAAEQVVGTYSSHPCPPSDYAHAFLNIPRFHPLLGALADIAVCCFRDPFGCDEDLFWEDIHPGWLYERAVHRLAQTLVALPESHEDAYHEALRAYGFDYDLWVKRLHDFRGRYAAEGVASAGEISMDDLLPDHFVQVFQRLQKNSFLEALSLRADCPMVYFEHTLASSELRHRYSAATRPPVLVQPDAIFVSHGAGRSVTAGYLCVLHALTSYFIEESLRTGSLDRTVSYARRGLHGSIKFFQAAQIRSMFLAIIGKAGQGFVDGAMRRIESE
jgi:hypothetical protein